jgi:hypothetical protein
MVAGTGRGGQQLRVRCSVRLEILKKFFRNDRTRWWTPGPDAVVRNDASGAASGAASDRCLTPFFNSIFDVTSPNQVPIQRDSNKHQLEPDVSDLTQTLKFS